MHDKELIQTCNQFLVSDELFSVSQTIVWIKLPQDNNTIDIFQPMNCCNRFS